MFLLGSGNLGIWITLDVAIPVAIFTFFCVLKIPQKV
jgi:hypothetical protein